MDRGAWQRATKSWTGLSTIEEGEGDVAHLCLTLCDPVDCSLPSEKSGKLEVGGASRDSTGFGALDEGLISS